MKGTKHGLSLHHFREIPLASSCFMRLLKNSNSALYETKNATDSMYHAFFRSTAGCPLSRSDGKLLTS